MKPFKVEGELHPKTIKVLGKFTEWEGVCSRLALDTEKSDGAVQYHPRLVLLVEEMRLMENPSVPKEWMPDIRKGIGHKWAEVCGVGAAYCDTVLFRHIAEIIDRLDQMKKRRKSNRTTVLCLVSRFIRQQDRLPYPSEVAHEMNAMGGKITTGKVREECEAMGISLPRERY